MNILNVVAGAVVSFYSNKTFWSIFFFFVNTVSCEKGQCIVRYTENQFGYVRFFISFSLYDLFSGY